MFTAFQGRPTVVRLHGTGEVMLPGDSGFDALIRLFPEHPGVRSIIVVAVQRVSDSCGYAVPQMTFVQDRDVLDLSNAKQGEVGLADYRRQKNSASVEGLPGLP
jgi:hypothetical protein